MITERVVGRLAREFAYHFVLETVMWEREPLIATEHFQTMITRPSSSDIVVVVLWSRLGTLLPEEKFIGPVSGNAVTGTEWEFEEAVKSYRENRKPALFLYRKRVPISGFLDDESALKRQIAQKKLVESFIAKWFGAADGPITAALHDFERVDEFEEKLEIHLRETIRSNIDFGEGKLDVLIRWHQGSPWRGLSAFEPEHAQVFFGRNRARAELRNLLGRRAAEGPAFIVVTGASGTGKSSLVKAGLIPDVCLPGMIQNVGLVKVAIMRPNDVDDRPIASLAAALLRDNALTKLCELGFSEERLANLLEQAPSEAVSNIGFVLKTAGVDAQLMPGVTAKLLVIVDQFEEIYLNARVPRDVRMRFIDALATLARSGVVWVVATLRSDVYSLLDETPQIADLLSGRDGHEGLFRLTPPTDTELSEIVARPAQEAGLSFETREVDGAQLSDVLVHAATRQPNSLPLLSFTLDELWRARTPGGLLTFKAYKDLGELEGAVANRAERILGELGDDIQCELPRVLRSLVSIGEDDTVSAQPARLSQFPPETPARALVDAFIAARLFVVGGDDDSPSVRLAHEALLSHWSRAKEQISIDRRDLETRALIQRQQARWTAATGQTKRKLLLRDLDLANAADLKNRWRDEIDPDTSAFILASQRQARRHQQFMTAAACVFACVAVIASLMSFFASQAQRRAQGNYVVAKGAIDSLIFDIASGLRGVQGMRTETIGLVLNTVEKNIDKLVEANPDDPELQRSRAVMYNNFVNTYRDAGDLPRAKVAAIRSLAIEASLARRQPDNLQVANDLSISQEKNGDVLYAQGDLNGALRQYESSLKIRQGLTKVAPENTAWQRDLSIAYENIGDVLSAQKNFRGALEAYHEDMKIMQQLASRDDKNLVWQRDLAIVYGRTGSILNSLGEKGEAINALQTSLSITKSLIAKDPTNVAGQLDLSVEYGRVGDAMAANNNAAGALAMYRNGLASASALAQQDPSNVIWQRNLFVSLAQVASVAPNEEALSLLTQAYSVAHNISKAHPADQRTARDLAWISARCRQAGCKLPDVR